MSEPMSRSPEQWAELIEEQARSGQSAAAFCREREVAIHRFRYWRRKLNEPVEERGFRQLRLGGATGVRLIFEDGRWKVELDRGFDQQCLRDVLGVLG